MPVTDTVRILARIVHFAAPSTLGIHIGADLVFLRRRRAQRVDVAVIYLMGVPRLVALRFQIRQDAPVPRQHRGWCVFGPQTPRRVELQPTTIPVKALRQVLPVLFRVYGPVSIVGIPFAPDFLVDSKVTYIALISNQRQKSSDKERKANRSATRSSRGNWR